MCGRLRIFLTTVRPSGYTEQTTNMKIWRGFVMWAYLLMSSREELSRFSILDGDVNDLVHVSERIRAARITAVHVRQRIRLHAAVSDNWFRLETFLTKPFADVAKWSWLKHWSGYISVTTGSGREKRETKPTSKLLIALKTAKARRENQLTVREVQSMQLFSSRFSLHQIALMGQDSGKKISEWFSPNVIAQVLKWASRFNLIQSIMLLVIAGNSFGSTSSRISRFTLHWTTSWRSMRYSSFRVHRHFSQHSSSSH